MPLFLPLKIIVVTAVLSFFNAWCAQAKPVLIKDHGVVGTTFVIQEEDLIDVITQKLQRLEEDGTLKQHQHHLTQHVQEKIKRPTPCERVVPTQKPRQYLYDPSIVVPEDLKDHQGRVFYHQGTKINPLSIKSLSKILLFIDGDDPHQVEWATQQGQASHIHIILVNGSPFTLMEQHDRRFYFDQGGVLIKKFGIEQVPARLSQQDQYLLIEEIRLEGKQAS